MLLYHSTTNSNFTSNLQLLLVLLLH